VSCGVDLATCAAFVGILLGAFDPGFPSAARDVQCGFGRWVRLAVSRIARLDLLVELA